MKIFTISISLLLVFFQSVFAEEKIEDCFSYEPEIISLTGIIQRETFPGPPNYSSIENGDEEMIYWILHLDGKICVEKNLNDPGQPYYNISTYNIAELQLVFGDDKNYDQYRSLLGKKVKVHGTLYHQYAARHVATILINVNDLDSGTGLQPIQSPNKKSKSSESSPDTDFEPHNEMYNSDAELLKNEKAKRQKLEQQKRSLILISIYCIVTVIALVLIWWIIVQMFKAVKRILYKINRFYNRIKIKSKNIGKKINNRMNGSKRMVSQILSHDKKTVGSGYDIKRAGFSFVKKSWVKAGVNRTLEQTGLDIKYTRHITNSLDSIGKDIWNLVLDCTKDLNNQCSNVFSSLIVLELYKLIFRKDIEKRNNMSQINDVAYQLQKAIEYQSVMGYEAEIDEARNRFDYIKQQFQ
jgi:hypothetical protein